jgi:DNA mismatch repair protein MutS
MPRSQSNEVPAKYIRKQTLVNNERFITEELKELEAQLLTARERLTELEYRIFKDLTDKISEMASTIRRTASEVAARDVRCSLAEVAVKNNYCMPEVDLSGVIDIKDGTAPGVELTQPDSLLYPTTQA